MIQKIINKVKSWFVKEKSHDEQFVLWLEDYFTHELKPKSPKKQAKKKPVKNETKQTRSKKQSGK